MNTPPAVGSLTVEPIPEFAGVLVRWPEQPESRDASIMPWHPSSARSIADITVDEFERGLEGRVPRPEIVDLARRLVGEARKTEEPEITIDVDGALAFDLRLSSGELMFAELNIEGVLALSVFDDSRQETRLVSHVSSATESEFIDNI